MYEQEGLSLITNNLYSSPGKVCRYVDVAEYTLDKDILSKLEHIRRRRIDNKNDNYVNYKDCFEEKSLKMIKTCELMEELIKNQPIIHDNDIDFSVCASGYWKAIEIELNIIFIDTIRKDKHIISSIPSQGISNKKGKYEVFAGYKYYNNKKLTKVIDINKIDKGRLCTCMFGEIISICNHYNENELGKIIYNLYSMIDKEKYLEMDYESINNEIYSFMSSIINETKEVVYKYRNKYSHTGIMTDKDLKELK